ncbi:MAG: sugar ABC transporter permease [Clostridia bacterium]|nr:sugar ABC transporter permease [Clostridia bacterium]
MYWLRRDAIGWVLLLPSLFCFTIFMWQPLISGIGMSFFDTKGFETTEFIGLENYVKIISDSGFVNAVQNTVEYALWSIVIGLFVPVIVAIMLNEMIHAKGFFRFAVYFPCMVPSIVTSVMWLIIFDPSAGGLLNHILSLIGLEPSQWLQNSSITIPLIVLTMTWGGFGSTTILYLADLQGVNTELYEAIEIDGGGIFKKLKYITLPYMSGMIKMMFIMQIIGVFQVFQQPLAMTGGGPNNASISLALVAYNYAFSSMEVGKSVATSVVTGLMIFAFTIVYMRLKKSNED